MTPAGEFVGTVGGQSEVKSICTIRVARSCETASRRIRHLSVSDKTNLAIGAAKENMAELNLQSIIDLAEADVLYLNFKKPSHADNTELTDDDVPIRYEKGDVGGVTFLHASQRCTITGRAA